MKVKKETRFYAAVFLISGVVMAMQILQSRLFSVTTWYHLSFLVISIAMFGMTLGAMKIYSMDEKEVRKNFGLIARKASLACGASILLGLLVQSFVPLVAAKPSLTLVILPLVAAATGAAYYFAGIILTVSLTRAPYPVEKIYGIDLLGAALGCLGALALMSVIDTPSGLIFLAGAASLAGVLYESGKTAPARNIRDKAIILMIATFVIGTINATMEKPLIYPIWAKNRYLPHTEFAYEKWNAISRITVMKETTNGVPFLWGPSPRLPKDYKVNFSFLHIDNDAGTPITHLQGGIKSQSWVDYDVTNIAYHMPGIEKAAIIGVGGGRDALSAKYFGVPEVTAMDVNPIQIHLLKDNKFFSPYAGLSTTPGLKLINSEARSWFRQDRQKFDLIEMSLIDTWAATGAGAFALSENGLYTKEAWKIFFDDLSDKGVFTVSRWSVQGYMDDTARLLSLAIATLFHEGVKDPANHIFLVNSDNIVTLVLSKSPFSQAQLNALNENSRRLAFNVYAAPGVPPKEAVLRDLLKTHDEAGLNKVASRQVYDISPTSDMRPFFFNQARFSMPLLIAKLALKGGPSTLFGQAKATFNLFLIIALSLIVVSSVILLPIATQMKRASFPLRFCLAGAGYFALIGLGFMLLEVSLLQAFGVYLGHPVYGLSIVMFSLILSTGLGSLLSGKISLDEKPAQAAWCAAVFLYAMFLAFGLAKIFTAFAEIALVERACISVALLFPLGILLGFGFPTGIRLAAKRDARATSWFWGINGAAGVLGSALAIAFNISLGIDTTLMIAGAAYALLYFPLIALARESAKG